MGPISSSNVCFSTPGEERSGHRHSGAQTRRPLLMLVHGVPKGPTNGLHLVTIPQRKLGREEELWVSAVAKHLRRGFLEFHTFTPKMFWLWKFPGHCGRLDFSGPRDCRNRICPSVHLLFHPPSHPTHPSPTCEHLLGQGPHADPTVLSSKTSGWEGQLHDNNR